MAGKLAKGGLVLAGLALAAAGAEVGVRVLRDVDYLRPGKRLERDAADWGDLVHRASAIPGLAYELAPGVEREARGMTIRTNSLGLRGPEPLPADTPGLVRIAALGDSITFGYRVEYEETWPAALAAGLNAEPPCAGRAFEVLDFGVAGYTTADEVLAFRHKGLALEPDLVVLGYFFNDPDIEPTQPLQRHFMTPAWWHHSAFLRWCAQVRRDAERKRTAGNDHWRWLHEPGSNGWRSVARGFADLAEMTAARSVPVVVVVFPLISPRPWADYGYRDLHAQVRAEAERHGFGVIDLLERYAEHDPAELMIAPDDFHPTPLGHAIVSSTVLAHLRAHPELVCDGGRD